MKKIVQQTRGLSVSTNLHLGIKYLGMLLIGILMFVLTLLMPLSPSLAYLFRHSYSFWLLGAVILFYFLYRQKQYWFRAIAFGSTLALFGLPLAGLWRVGFGEMQIIGGLLSFSDSARYYYEASRLLSGFPMTAFGARHPLAPGLWAALLGLTHNNLQWSLALCVLLNAMAVYFAARVIRQTHGPLISTLFLLLAFLFYRRFIGMTDTENVGFLLGMLAFIFLWQAAHQKDPRWALAGLFFSSLALNTRPGAFLILPALFVWALRTFARGKKIFLQKIFWFATGLVILPFVLNFGLARLTTSGKQPLFSNYAFTLYGIADGGSGWEQVYLDHPEIRSLEENDAARLSYQLAFSKLRNDPLPAVHSVFFSYGDFFSLKDQSAFGFVSGGDLTAFDQPLRENILSYQITRVLLWILTLSGLIWLWRGGKNPENSLLLCGALGLVLSVPFTPPRDAAIMRVYAASIPFLILVPGMGLMWLRSKTAWLFDISPNEMNSTIPALGLGALISLLMVIGPLILRLATHPRQLAQISCKDELVSSVVQVRPGSYLLVQDKTMLPATHLPLMQYDDFLTSLEQFPYGEMIRELGTLKPPFLLMNALDLRDGNLLWVVLPEEAARLSDDPVAVCGQWMPGLMENGFGFLRVESLQALK